MIEHSNGYLEEYRLKIEYGDILAGVELWTELSKLMEEMQDDRYIYDTRDADLRMDFMEHCIRLTKSPFLWSANEADVVAESFYKRSVWFQDD